MDSPQTIHISPPEGGLGRPLADLWTHRGLVRFFIWRDLKVRYRQTLVGAGWAVAQPLVLMAIFSVFLTGIIPIPGDELPYWLFAFTGLVPWTLFAQSLSQASNSLVNHPELIQKAAFPRIVLPVSAVGPYLMDFAIATAIAFVATAVAMERVVPSMALTPLVGLMGGVVSLALGIGLSAVNVKFRDVKYATPFMLQALLFAAPVVYPISLAHESIRSLVWLNPMTAVIELYRWTLFGGPFPEWTGLLTGSAVAVLLLGVSAVYFHRSESYFADVI